MSFIETIEFKIMRKIPLMVSLVFVVLSLIPCKFAGCVEIKPMLSMTVVYFWSVFRPDLFGLISTFIVGVSEDVLGSGVLGLNTFLYLIIHWMVTSNPRYFDGKSFSGVWWGFTLISALYFIAKYLLFIFLTATIPPFTLVIFSYVMTGAFYLPVSWFCFHARAALEEV